MGSRGVRGSVPIGGIERPGSPRAIANQVGSIPASRPTYDLSKAVLWSALSLDAIFGASSALGSATGLAAAGYGFLAFSGGLGLGVGLALIVVFSIAEFTGPQQTSELIAAGEFASVMGSPSGLVATTAAGLSGRSASEMQEWGTFAATIEGIMMWDPSRVGGSLLKPIGETVNTSLDVYQYVADKMPHHESPGGKPTPSVPNGGSGRAGIEDRGDGRSGYDRPDISPGFQPENGAEPSDSSPRETILLEAGQNELAEVPTGPIEIGQPETSGGSDSQADDTGNDDEGGGGEGGGDEGGGDEGGGDEGGGDE